MYSFVAADWMPLVAPVDGGPVVGDAPDMKVALDDCELGWAHAGSLVADAAVEHLRTADPHALFVYLGDPDETSHATDSIGPPYLAAIAGADRQVGRLVEALEARPGYADEDWLVLVSTDHGRRPDGGHGGDSVEERTIFYLASGPAVADSLPAAETPGIVDVAVTPLAHLGFEPDPTWELDGRVRGLSARVPHR